MADKIKQWPDHITSGEIRYSPGARDDGTGFVLRDAMHGIPVFGSVNVEVFNYPGQTEEIAKTLCDRWNAYPKLVAALVDLLKPGSVNGAVIEAGRDLLAELGHNVR